MATAEQQRDPYYHTKYVQRRLNELVGELREELRMVDEPQFKAMFETTAEVLGGLSRAFGDYERRNEAAWRG
ncbi:MAG TPA: hypothetical protein VF194_11625 [Ferrovibrio sp.]|uniref:hypothetical protein n=1 Tax=Ferrovibrio sp. TaxID=1917215 RepID=UPI002ED4B634